MRIGDIFETRIEETIEPVIKVGEQNDNHKLASEIGSYVVTPTIERYLDDFLDHYTDTLRIHTTEIGIWISGYFGSGKSHLAKIVALLVENRMLEGLSAAKRFESRISSDAPYRTSLIRSLFRLTQCDTRVLAFNLNSLADNRSTSLPRLLLSQFYLSKGYGANVIYARVIEAELDKRGKLDELHAAAERLTKKTWTDIQKNLGFYSRALYQAVCEVVPEIFSKPEDVAQALVSAEKGELYNTQFLIRTLSEDLEAREKSLGKPCRFVFVLDEAAQWIEDSGDRLSQLQAFVEEAAIKCQGKIWVAVTTHEDMGSIYSNVKKLEAHGDFKKIEGRFRFKWNLTTENIELVLEDRIFKKKLAGKNAVIKVYDENPGILRDLGQLANTSQKLPECSKDRFSALYPFFPYQIHLIPEIVKSLRSAGGRGEQLSGSTRTLLAITQDILRSGRRQYLDLAVGEIVSFDEVYYNLVGEGEVNSDVRREIGRILEVVHNANLLTARIAEILYLIRELSYIPRTIDNLARLLVEATSEDLTIVLSRIEPELKKLMGAKLVAKVGEEYEFLTGERRTFETEVAEEAARIRLQDLRNGLANFASTDVLGFETIPFSKDEFSPRIFFDETPLNKEGHIALRIFSPLTALSGVKVSDLEDRSLLPDEQQTIFVLSDRISSFDEDVRYYLALRTVINRWKGDSHKSEQAHKLAAEREASNLEKQKSKVIDGIKEGLKRAQIIFRGSCRTVSPRQGHTSGEVLRTELAAFWPSLYPKYEKVPVKILNEQRAILDVMKGVQALSPDVRELKLFDKTGQLDLQSPLLDSIRLFLSIHQSRKERVLGRDLLEEFVKPPYGWNTGAIRVGVAALIRSGALRVLINKKPYTNSADEELQDNVRVSRNFDKIELELEEIDVKSEVLADVRTLLIKVTGKRKIDETPAALSEEMGNFSKELVDQADRSYRWAEPAGFPLAPSFQEGNEVFEHLLVLTNPAHRVNEIYTQRETIIMHVNAIRSMTSFVEKWGRAYTDMRDFARQLDAIEHHLPSQSKSISFLDNWKTAQREATVSDESVWKDLQNAKAVANVELEALIVGWREEARSTVQAALDGLLSKLDDNKLPKEDLLPTLTTPLLSFIAILDEQKDVIRVAFLSEKANRLVNEMNEVIADERQNRVFEKANDYVSSNDSHTIISQVKTLKHIRVADLASSTRIQTETEWFALKDKLDETIRQELASGHEVELE